jgi:hypothetical protein
MIVIEVHKMERGELVFAFWRALGDNQLFEHLYILLE